MVAHLLGACIGQQVGVNLGSCVCARCVEEALVEIALGADDAVVLGIVAIDANEIYLLESHVGGKLYHRVCYRLSAIYHVGNVVRESYGVLCKEHLVVCHPGDVIA